MFFPLQWYKDLEPWWSPTDLKAHLQHAKCKGQYYRSTTPPGVWDISFPDRDLIDDFHDNMDIDDFVRIIRKVVVHVVYSK